MGEVGSRASQWDEDLAAELLGSLVLIGFTRLTHDGELMSREQRYGRVVAANRSEGICIAWQDDQLGEHYWLPPSTRSFRALPPGTYEVVSTGEAIENPAFIASWTIAEPPPDFKPPDDDS